MLNSTNCANKRPGRKSHRKGILLLLVSAVCKIEIMFYSKTDFIQLKVYILNVLENQLFY